MLIPSSSDVILALKATDINWGQVYMVPYGGSSTIVSVFLDCFVVLERRL